jgi:transposase InsO family protein
MESSKGNQNIDKLSDDNWQDWQFNITMLLKSKGLWKHTQVDLPFEQALLLKKEEATKRSDMSTTTTPHRKREKSENINSQLIEKAIKDGNWEEDDEKALALIGLSISSKFYSKIGEATTCFQAWHKLKKYFTQVSTGNIMLLKCQFYEARMAPNDSLLGYLDQVVRISERLKGLGSITDEKEICYKVLGSIPKEYNPITMACMLLPQEQLTLSFLRHQFSLEQSRASMSQEKEGATMQNPISLNTDSSVKCTKCGYKNHTATECYAASKRIEEYQRRKKKDRGRQQTEQGKEKVVDKQNITYVATAFVIRSSHDSTNHLAVYKAEQKTFSASHNIHDGDPNDWYLDSGCTQHMTRCEVSLGRKHIVEAQVSGAIGTAVAKSTIAGEVIIEGDHGNILLKEVLYVPGLAKNLVSVRQICHQGDQVTFEHNTAYLRRKGRIILTATLDHGLYRIDGTQKIPSGNYKSHQQATSESSRQSQEKPMRNNNENSMVSVTQWHERFGHLSHGELKKIFLNGTVRDVQVSNPNQEMGHCEACALGKQTRIKFKKNTERKSLAIGDIIHTDVMGPLTPVSIGGAKYVLTFMDDFSRFSWVYFLKHKSEVYEKFKIFHPLFCTQTGTKIKTIRSDGGGEYISLKFKKFMTDQGITHAITPAYTPQLNGVAERLNRTLMDKVRSMVAARHVPTVFWAEAISTANFLRNRSPTKVLGNKTPLETLTNKRPSAINLRTFGCLCYITVVSRKKKLDSRSKPGMFLGYAPESNCWRIWDVEMRQVILSRDVRFMEDREVYLPTVEDDKISEKSSESTNSFPGTNSIPDTNSTPDTNSIPGTNSIPDTNSIPGTNSTPGTLQLEEEEVPSLTSNSSSLSNEEELPLDDIRKSGEHSKSSSSSEQNTAIPQTAPTVTTLRRSTRERKPPGPFWKASGLLAINAEPVSFKKMLESDDRDRWLDAISEEMDSLKKMGTWDLVSRPSNHPVVKNKWIFKVKTNPDGSIERYKARLVAKGFTQTEGVDYFETFSPVVKFETLRFIISFAAEKQWNIAQMDVKTAFLHGELEEEIYMEPPEGFPNSDNQVCRLKKSLYGLKQSPRCWNSKFTDFMKRNDFTQGGADPCLFIKKSGEHMVIVGLYVDDLVITGHDVAITRTKELLINEFEMKDLGKLKYILGIEVDRKGEEGGYSLQQTKYINSILKRFSMEECKPVNTPALKPLGVSTEVFRDVSQYQQAVGSLNYLATCTRPDLAFAISQVARKMHQPTEEDWLAVKRIFRYLQATKSHGLHYSSKRSNLIGYSDASYAPEETDRKSVSGYVYLMNGGAISWKSKRQPIISLSSMEAEYIALSAASKESMWLHKIQKDLYIKPEPMIIREDNQATIKMANNIINNDRSKHIDVRYHFIREKVSNNILQLEYCQTSDMVADIFTKPLGRNLLEKHVSNLGLSESKH